MPYLIYAIPLFPILHLPNSYAFFKMQVSYYFQWKAFLDTLYPFHARLGP